MRYCKYILLTISVVLGLFACQKDEDVTIAQLNIKNEVITPSYTSADIECWIECNVKFNQAKVECALTQDFQSPIVVAMEQSKGKYVAQVVDLQYDTTYYVRYIISNRMSAMTYEKIKSFKTLKPSVPTVQLDSVANIWDVTANACAQIIKDGGLPVTEWGICLKVSTGADSLFMKADSQSLSQQIVCAGLQPNTTYRVRAYAKNAVGTGYSEERTFTTFALPTVETKDVSNIKLTTALLSGMLVFNGNDSATVKGFCWGLKTNPTIDGNRNQVVVDTVGNAYTYLLSNLKDETKYYVRAYARNKIGVTYGEEKMFTTQAAVVPVVSTTAASSITSVSAKVGGNVTADGGAEVTERGICYSTTKNPTTASTKLASGKGMGSYVCDLTGLQANTTYYVRAYAINKKGTAYGEEVTFTTNKNIVPPTVTTSAVTQITETTAVAGGNVTADGGASVTERGVVYSTSQNPTTANTKKVSGSGTGAFTCNLTGLQASTTYYVRAYAINEKGTAYGEQVSFKTLTPIVPPTVNTSAVTQITETTAVAGGNVTVDGGASVTERGVVYSTTANPTTANTKKVSGSGTGAFTCNLTGLQASTTYYVRAYAINEKGTSYGEQVTFKTLEEVSATPEYVDLGLSVKWADRNVGASKPEEYGDYFAWGETEPKSTYSWSTYKWCNGRETTLTKYNNSSSYGTVDNKTQLELSDDAARVNWGGSWRMPTKAEQDELRENCTWTWTSQNGVNGYKVTSKKSGYTNKSIFLPAAGYRSGGRLGYAGNNGAYWSSSLYPSYPVYAYELYFHSGNVRCNYYNRDYGRSVRPVYGEYVPEINLPVITTSTITQIAETTAVAGGNVTADGGASVTERGVVYSTSQNPTTANTKKVSGSGTGAFTCNLTGLQASTTYYVRAYAINEKGTAYGEQVSFKTLTPIVPPTVTTSAVTQITETTAVAGGNVTADGGASVTERGVVYSTTANPTTANTKKVSGSGTGAFTCNLTGLQAGTTYYVRAYAINEKGTAYGEQVTFKTSTPIVPPTVTTSAITQITETTAVAGGNVTSDGGASVTERGVVYSTTANPTTANTKKVSGSGTGAFTCNLTGLQASTTYYVRAYAINEKGTSYGEQVTFKTLTPIVPPTVTTSAVTQITETTAVAGGNVTSDGGASVTERGVVYSTTANPTTANTKKVSGSGTGAFTCNMSGLLAGTTYYVRAYAINEKGTAYGEEVSFVTKNLSSSIYVPTNEELWEIFKPYYNTYYDLWRADQPIGKVSTFAVSKMLEIMTDSESGFKWLGDYIMPVSTEQGYSLDTETGWRWAVHSFFNCNQNNSYPFPFDFTIAGQPAAWGAAYQAAYNEGRTVTIILETSSVTEYTETTAVVDCEIIYSSDMTITERGVVYGTIQKPTISNSKVTSGSGTGSFTCNLTGLQAGTMYHVRSYAINEKGIAYGRQRSFTTKAEVATGTENGYEYVDLGLSVKWATINVGATKPEEYGDYFAWGETEPKSTYNWSSYKYCNGSSSTLTKYNTVSSRGTVDNKTTLELSDDAARVNWGGSWRMPTFAELTELRENCTWTWTTQNGVNGYKVTSKSNGNSIFLPAAGVRDDSSLKGAGSSGYYCSSSLDTGYPYLAYGSYFYSDSVYRNYYYERYYGHSVRPVCQ